MVRPLGTIANGYIQNWVILARKLVKPKKSLSGDPVKWRQDHRVITVSLTSMEIVNALPPFDASPKPLLGQIPLKVLFILERKQEQLCQDRFGLR
jgi:hypothetical protein